MFTFSVTLLCISICFTLLILFLPEIKKKRTFSSTILFLLVLISSTLFFITHSLIPDYTYLFVLWLMSLSLSLTDYLYQIVEPCILYPFSLITFISYCSIHSLTIFNLSQSFLFFLVFYILDSLLPNSIGGGDIKLLIIYAFFLPFLNLLYLILIASFLGIFFLLFTKKILKKDIIQLPFVPFLTLSFLLISFYFQ